jgi:hypothetical protein
MLLYRAVCSLAVHNGSCTVNPAARPLLAVSGGRAGCLTCSWHLDLVASCMATYCHIP